MKILGNFRKSSHKDWPSVIPEAPFVDTASPASGEGPALISSLKPGITQSIIVDDIVDKTYGDPDFKIQVKTSSGLPVVITAAGCCSNIDNIIHIEEAGNCTLTIHQEGNNEYQTAEDISITFNVNPARLRLKADDKKMVYGSRLPVFSASISGLVRGFEPLGTLEFETEASPFANAGDYPVVPYGLNSKNYTYEYIPGIVTIQPAPLTVKVEDRQIHYGESLPEFNVRVSGLVNNDVLESLGTTEYRTIAKQGSSVGTFPVTAEGLNSPNYDISFVEGKLDIMPVPLEVTASDKNMLYGEQLPEFTVRASGLVNGDVLESLGLVEVKTDAVEGSPVASYSIMPCGLNSSNYALNYIQGTLTISPVLLTVKAEDKTIKFGEQIPEFTAEVSGLVNGDTMESLGPLTCTIGDTLCSEVGSYNITPFGLTSPNYTYEYVSGNLFITPAPLIVKADDKSVIYGAPLPEFSAFAEGLVNGDSIESLGDLTFSTSIGPENRIGTYSIIPGGLTNPNYTYEYVEGILTILSIPVKEPINECRALIGVSDSETKDDKPDSALSEKRPKLGEVLVNEGSITREELTSALSRQLDVPMIDINTYQFEREALTLVSESLARQYNVIPLAIRSGYLVVAMADPTDIIAIEALTAQTKKRVKPMIAPPDEIKKAIDRNYKSLGELESQFTEVKSQTEIRAKILDESIAEKAPAVRALDIIVEEAIKNRASDIHIEPEENRVRIRYRIDGVMHEVSFLPLSAHSPLISRLKVLAGMNIADRRPQDGQFNFKAWDKDVDIRVATISTAYGEMGTLRILDKSFAVRTLKDIGYSPENLKKYEKMMKSPFGMILISGPTGSGKTTTLYASINSLDCKELKIITIEDPVEYHFDGITQIQVNPRAGLTFSDGLRAIMRHDPDVALVGEVRDRDTAAVAVQASLTGHLVLASVHANDTVGVLFRLIDLGVEPFMLASALVGVVAQRMVRRVCPRCSEESPGLVEHQTAYQEELGETREKFFYGKGCQTCANTGYLGRTAVMEILRMSDELRRLLLSGASISQIRAQAVKEGMISMRHDGMLKVKAGITTPNEVLRNVFSIE